MPSSCRDGFSIIELLVAVLMMGVLAAIALPTYQKVLYRARAGRIVADMHAVRTAAYQYQVDQGEWPPDTDTGVFPPSLDPYVSGIDFVGPGYELDWDRWGPYEDIDLVLGISVFVDNPLLEAALLSTLETSDGAFMRVDHRYTYFVEQF